MQQSQKDWLIGERSGCSRANFPKQGGNETDTLFPRNTLSKEAEALSGGHIQEKLDEELGRMKLMQPTAWNMPFHGIIWIGFELSLRCLYGHRGGFEKSEDGWIPGITVLKK